MPEPTQKPMDINSEPDWAWLRGKTVIITGGANGLGRGMAVEWAKHGACLVIGDLDEKAGPSTVEELKRISGHKNHSFRKCDVTSWDSQLDLFKHAVTVGPGKHVDVVVANAGIGESDHTMFRLDNDTTQEPKKPNLKTIDIDLIALLYTSHLAYHFFSLPSLSSSSSSSSSPRLHSLLLLGSIASIKYSPEPMYAAAKHGVLGLFRTLRRPHFFTNENRNLSSDKNTQVNVSLICPYFTDTNIIRSESGQKILPDEVELTKIEDVVEAAGRLILDKEGGRALGVMTETFAKAAGRGKHNKGIYELTILSGPV